MPSSPEKTALVTGAAGFVGSHLVDHLREHRYRVVAVDNLFRGRPSNLAHRADDKDTVFIIADIRNHSAMRRLFDDFRPDLVFHLAAIAFIPYNVAHPTETLDVNVSATQALLEVAQAVPPRSFVFASTADVYIPQNEANHEEQPTGPYNIYGISKGFAERLIALAAEAGGSQFIATRFFNVYGTRETNPHIVPEVVDQSLSGDRTILIGNLWPKRDYVFVSDVVDALLRLAEHSHGARYEVFNIGTGTEYSVQEVIEILGRILGRVIEPVVDETRTRRVERDHLVADIAKIRRVLGWQPRFTLEAGLRELVKAARV